MANKKISELNELTDLTSEDEIVAVDTSESETKRITGENLFLSIFDNFPAASRSTYGYIAVASVAQVEAASAEDHALTPTFFGQATDISNYSWMLDEDDMASDDAVKVASQQSIKAYVDLRAPIADPTFTGEIGIGAVNVSETELGILEGATLTTTELNYVDGVTSALQTQLDTKLEKKDIQIIVIDYTADLSTGDGKAYVTIPSSMNGFDLTAVHAEVITAGTTGTTDIQIYNVTQTTDVLTTKITIDSTETGSDTAATPAVIDTANDDVASYDVIRIDVDAVATTAPKGLIVTLTFN